MAKLTLEVEAISLNEGLEMALYIEEMWNEKRNLKGVRVIVKTGCLVRSKWWMF